MNSESFRASAACGCMGAKLTCLYLCRYNEKELYAVVADVASYPKFIPFCTGSRIDPLALERAMQGKTVVDAELTVGFLSFKESYVSSVTCIPFKSVQVRSCVLQSHPYRLDHWGSGRPLHRRLHHCSRLYQLLGGSGVLLQIPKRHTWIQTVPVGQHLFHMT